MFYGVRLSLACRPSIEPAAKGQVILREGAPQDDAHIAKGTAARTTTSSLFRIRSSVQGSKVFS